MKLIQNLKFFKIAFEPNINQVALDPFFIKIQKFLFKFKNTVYIIKIAFLEILDVTKKFFELVKLYLKKISKNMIIHTN